MVLGGVPCGECRLECMYGWSECTGGKKWVGGYVVGGKKWVGKE